jgi:small conductance mechanosensitive channel
MRIAPLFGLFLVLAVGVPAFGAAAAQPQAAPAAAPAAASTQAAPAKPASAIIPGSPLAALTAAASSPADSDANTPAPFGTTSFGFSLANTLGREAAGTFDEFLVALQKSMQLTPVWDWLQGFPQAPVRRAHLLSIAKGLGVTIVPALVVEAVLKFVLARLRSGLISRSVPLPAVIPAEGDEEQGLADAEAGGSEKLPGRRVSLRAWARRGLFALLYFGVRLLPLLGFALSVAALLANGLAGDRPAHLAVAGIANAYLLARFVAEVLGVLVAPGAPSLRLITMPGRRAASLMRQTVVVLATIFIGYAIVSIAQLLGLGQLGAQVLTRLIALAVHVQIAIAIWNSRHLVGRWIAGPQETANGFAAFRRRVGSIWHYPALFYILALWVAWAGGVQNAFAVLLRAVLVCLAALVLGRIAWTGSSNLLERIFPDAPDTAHPALFARARAYNPLIRVLIRVGIGMAVIVLVLQGWGVNAVGWLFTNPISVSLINAGVSILITIALALVLWECANLLLAGRIERFSATGRTRQAARLRTLLPMLRATIGVSISLVAGLICLSKIGVNAAPLLAGAGVLGIAIGFGSQKLVQDVITGLFLLLEDAMQVGDVVSLAGMTGTVERLSIRTIRLRGGDGSINIIPFSAVTTVTNMTRDFSYAQVSIDVGYQENLNRVFAVLQDLAKAMRAEPAWGAMIRDDFQLFGLDQFGANGLVITGQIRTGPGQHWAVRREFYARIYKRFADEGISIPSGQQSFTIDPGTLQTLASAVAVSAPRPPAPAGPPPGAAPG